ncbi:hypothetical protein TraAM80_03632 [Trypanosoma rangeli]|uniref:Uncharacterized protein n=1 Tax=Trypanosoma rangeli TaxID=5698 RepID=A0A422NMJ2_TRYRA|nr:uncharacterized protein TraAM80_03632 [Trypanosoma rangeli]RNF06685.1 hypothetical protein TraAM80_03632 [Trypanosoma rangeli]|eukprot:RNF06685.1 hypothetical protein TraAM80_03632 [Trypanosoma rangeli]
MRGGTSLFFAVVVFSVLLCLPAAARSLTQREFEFELWPTPKFLQQTVGCGLQKQWFVLNEQGRPFSIASEGHIKLNVTSIAYDVTALRGYLERLLHESKPGEVSRHITCLLFTQPRLFRVTQQMKSISDTESKFALNASIEEFLDEYSMLWDAVLMLKVFVYGDWLQLIKKTKTAAEESIDDLGDLSEAELDASTKETMRTTQRICTAPALLTEYIDVADAFHVTMHRIQMQSQTPVIAILVQCSYIPLNLKLTFHMSNTNGRGSAEHISTECMYLVFFIAYIVLFAILLFLIIPCGTSCTTSSAISSASASDEDRPAVPRSSLNVGSATRMDNANAMEESAKVASKYLEEKEDTLNLAHLDRMQETLTGVETTNSPVTTSSPTHQSFRACRKLFCAKTRHACSLYLLILYPPLQWLVLACLILGGAFCLLELIRYRALVEYPENLSESYIGIVSIFVSVASRTAVFVMQQFVCIGWGCAYQRPPTIKLVTACLASVITFFAYVFNGSCKGGGFSVIYSLYDKDTNVGVRCSTIQTVVVACELLGWVLNLFQLTTLMATIGRAAMKGSPRRRPSFHGELTSLYLRYRSMCVPYALGMLLPQVLFIVFSNTLMGLEDHYVEVALREFSQWYPLAFVLIFLRKEPFYF